VRELAGLFAIEVCGYCVMSSHLHFVLRNRPDIAEQWSAEEIALRWCRVFPPRDGATGEPVEPDEHDLAMLTANSYRPAQVRKRLANLSWFMRCLCEKIARAANHEDGSIGRFWAGRFKSAPIMERLGVTRSNWVETVRGFGRMFKQAAGRSSSLVDAAARRSRRWFQGKAAARAAFV
jgi:hypothetical protein